MSRTIGSAIGTVSLISPSGTLEIHPSGSEEWVIHNLYFGEATFDIQIISSNATITFDSFPGPGALTGFWFHLTNSQYLRIINKGSETIPAGYDGIVTKV